MGKTIKQKVEELVYFFGLTKWERRFISGIFFKLDGTPDFLHEQAVLEYLTEGEVLKVKEIYNERILKKTS